LQHLISIDELLASRTKAGPSAPLKYASLRMTGHPFDWDFGGGALDRLAKVTDPAD
jgi:hypothetical protein